MTDVVHYAAFRSGGLVGFQRLCDAPWSVSDGQFRARVRTENGPTGRTMMIIFTGDPVDCMTCLVARGR